MDERITLLVRNDSGSAFTFQMFCKDYWRPVALIAREITFDISEHVKIPSVLATCLWLNVAPHNLSWLEEPGTAHTVPGNLQTPQRAVPPVHDGAYFRTLILRNGAPTGRDVSKSVAGTPATCLSNVSRALSRSAVDATDMLSDLRAAGPTHVDRTRALSRPAVGATGCCFAGRDPVRFARSLSRAHSFLNCCTIFQKIVQRALLARPTWSARPLLSL